MDCFFVFILSDHERALMHTGLTHDLQRLRRSAGQTHAASARVVYYELSHDPDSAMRRVRQIRSLRRVRRKALVCSMNPQWDDLTAKW